MNIFDHLKRITSESDHNFLYNASDDQRSEWSSLVITKFISMDSEYTELMSYLLKFQTVLNDAEYYKLLSSIVPKEKRFFEYIKSKESKEYNVQYIEHIKDIYNCSEEKAKDYIDLLTPTQLEEIIKQEGLSN